MTNYELIKTLQRTRLGGALSHANLNNRLDKEQVLNTLFSFFPCVECNLHTKETCGESTKDCKDTLAKWLDSPVDDIIVLSKLPKKFSYSELVNTKSGDGWNRYASGWNDCISYIQALMLSSEEENIE